MEIIRKQASKLREQVARQQQALLRQLGRLGIDDLALDEDDLECRQQLENLHRSTRAAKHFQKDIIRNVEGFVSISSKQMEIARRLAEDCCRYGTDNQCSTSIPEVAFQIGCCHSSMENEREPFLGILGAQVCEPLRALVRDTQLEDARLLIRHYDRLWQDMETQASEVVRLRSKLRDGCNDENSIKIHLAEAKLNELKSRMKALGKEATLAMSSVETHQQKKTFQQLLIMVGAERSYHQSVLCLLEKLHIEDKQFSESASPSRSVESDLCVPVADRVADSNECHGFGDENYSWFIAKAVHEFDAQEEGELNLSLDDILVVYQVIPSGWSKGECNDRVGWFPSAYIEKLENIEQTSDTNQSPP
ncbi:hypothetical protein Dimus_030098 [Dionaea muscipula]